MEAGAGLSRCDLASVGPIPSCNTLKLLPFGKSRRQKILVGDGLGNITCLQAKRGETQTVFKAKVGEEGGAITSLALHDGTSGDKFYAAQGRNVHGVNKKGRAFCCIKTSLSETIQNVQVRDKQVWVAGDLTYASYTDGRETSYLNCADSIGGFAVTRDGQRAVLGGRDHLLRTVEKQNVLSQLATGGGVTVVEPYTAPFAGALGQQGEEVFMYGTDTGEIGLVRFAPGGAGELELLWALRDEGESAVNCMVAYELSKDGVNDIIVGRDDGRLQIFRPAGDPTRPAEAESKHDEPKGAERATLQFERSVGESIRAVQAGVVSQPGYDQIVLCTFSGNIVSFSTEALDEVEEGDKMQRSKAAVDADGKAEQMEQELARLQKQVDATRAKLEKAVRSSGGQVSSAGSGIGFRQLQVCARLSLTPGDACYTLSLEMPIAIHLAVLQSTIPFSLVDSERTDHSLVVSQIAGHSEDRAYPFELVCRCTEPSKRVQLRLRTIEGQYGEVRCTVVANVEPKVGQQVTLEVKPLSLHQQRAGGGDLSGASLSSVQFTGSFSLYQVHDWIRTCLPDVPQNPTSAVDSEDVEGEKVTRQLWFENVLTKSVLIVRYCAGLAVIESDSVSTIAIMREVVSAEANRRKVAINIKFSIDPKSTPRFLRKLDRRLHEHGALAKQVELVEALREITNEAGDSSYLSKEHRAAMSQPAPQAERSSSSTGRRGELDALFGVVRDLYVDAQKFDGRDARNPATHAELTDILHHYDFDRLSAFFTAAR